MSGTRFKGHPVHVDGHFPQVGDKAHPFKLIAGDLSEKSLADFAGKRKVLNIFPSVDTPVCAASVR
ncbi:MAG: redoxin family protein, partial [Rhodanobacteraceae bacterium]